jgi:hypothetical protein
LATTRLAQWDLLHLISFADPANTPVIATVSIQSNDSVLVQIGYESGGTQLTVMGDTYLMSSALAALFGSTVAGYSGEYIRSDNWSHGTVGGIFKTGWEDIISDVGFPWISYFRVQRGNAAFPIAYCPVIGDVDTPQVIELRGDMVDPIIGMASSDIPLNPLNPTAPVGAIGMSSTMRLIGTTSEDNPVFVDVGRGKIYDSTGANRYSMLSYGSLHHFQPGHNYVAVGSMDWGSHPAHAHIFWRDALS